MASKRKRASAKELVATLLSAADSSDAVRKLYLFGKERSGHSIAWLCDKAGIPSKGYLSDVMHGRRIVNKSYEAPLAGALGLHGLEAKYFALLATRDRLDPAARGECQDRLNAVRKALNVVLASIPTEMASDSFAFEVFCAFGLFKMRPVREQLVAYFGEHRRADVRRAIDELIRSGYVCESGTRYEVTAQQVSFVGSATGAAHLEFLRSAILDAGRRVETWSPKRDVAHFESMVISVRKDHYIRLLQRLRDELFQWQSDLETEDADLLVRFNAQVYPLGV